MFQPGFKPFNELIDHVAWVDGNSMEHCFDAKHCFVQHVNNIFSIVELELACKQV